MKPVSETSRANQRRLSRSSAAEHSRASRCKGASAAGAAGHSFSIQSDGAPPRSETITKDLTQATILLGRQAVRQVDPDYFPLAVGSYILGGGSASRLYGRVRDEGGLAYAVFSYVSPGRYGAAFTVSAQTRTAETAKVVDILRAELGRMTRDRVKDDELKLAKDYLIGSFPLRLDTTAKVADFVIAIEEQGLGLDYADRYKASIAKVTAADVQRVAQKFFVPDTFNQVVVGAAK